MVIDTGSAIGLTAGALALGYAHWRFRPPVARCAPAVLLLLGVLSPLCAFSLGASADACRNACWPTVLAVLGALSVLLRFHLAGIPARYVPPPGPSNTDLLAALLAERQAMQAQARAAESRLHASSLEQLAAIQAIDGALQRFVTELRREQHATFLEVLSGVVDDFNSGIVAHYRRQLAVWEETVQANHALFEKQRAQLASTMHDARRSAAAMEASGAAFRTLIEQSTQLAAIGARLDAAFELLAPRQETLELQGAALAGSLAQANTVLTGLQDAVVSELDGHGQRTRRALEAASQRLGQQLAELQQSVQRGAEQARAQIGDTAGKHQQQLAAIQKELAETLPKQLASINKQLGGVSSKLGSDLGPLVQHLRRVADLAKTK